jgi:hypothetical protein
MRLAFEIVSALFAAPAAPEVGDVLVVLFAPMAIGAVDAAAPLRDPNIMTTKATIATAPTDSAAINNRARGEMPELRTDIVILPLDPTLRT